MRTNLFIIISALFIILLAGSAYASVSQSSFDLNVLTYNPSETLKGFLSLALSAENADNIIKADVNSYSFNMSLSEFLKKNNANFTCSPSDCKSYFETSGNSQLDLILNANSANYFGFNLRKQGTTNVINPGLSFNIETFETFPFEEQCGEVPVIIDLLNDGDIEYSYVEAYDSENYCSSLDTSDCYSQSAIMSNLNLRKDKYCQKMTLNPTSRIKLGAEIRKKTQASYGILELSINDLNENSAICSINKNLVSSSYAVQTCEVNFTIKEKDDYYVCINSDDLSGYEIKSESQGDKCGYGDLPYSEDEESTIDFALYAQIAKIKPFTGLKFNNTLFDSTDYLDEYLAEEYKNDCTKGCIVPISIFSQKKVKMSDIGLEISYGESYSETVERISNLIRKPVLITMPLTKLSFDAMEIKAPEDYGNYALKLSINNVAVAPVNGSAETGKKFSVVAVPQINSLMPLVVFASLETNFKASASSPVNNTIKGYTWDFGDGEIETTNSSSVKHTYSKVGDYNITLSVEDSEGFIGEKTFAIKAGTSKEAVILSLENKKSAVEEFSKKLETLPKLQQDIIKLSFNEGDLSEEISLLEKEYDEIVKADGTDEDYFAIKERLDELVVPIDIKESAELKEMEYVPSIEEIEPEYVKTLGGGSFDSSLADETKKAISAWQSAKLSVKTSGKVISAVKDDYSTEDLFTIINVKLIPVESLGKFYFIVDLPSGVDFNEVKFSQQYNQKDAKGAIGFEFDGMTSEQTIEFAMPGKQEMLLNMFASADLDNLEVIDIPTCGNTLCEKEFEETYKNCPEDCKPTSKALMWIAIIVLGGALGVFLIWKFYAAIYDLMQQRKFFKTRQDYINILIYISSSLKRGQSEQEVRDKLSKAGWKKEQLDYVMAKSLKAFKKFKKKAR